MPLSYVEIKRFAETSAAVALLRGDDYIADIAFLTATFRGEGNVVIGETELRQRLGRWLDVTFDAHPEARPDWRPQERIAHYVKQEFLRKREPAAWSEPVYELTSDIDRVLTWVEDQRRREFVGTEYGLRAIMRDLREVAARASGDWQQRWENLRRQKEEIEREMDLLAGDPESAKKSDGRYILENVQRLERASQDLVSDFSVLRERFTELARDVARQHSSGTAKRGEVLRLALDGEDALRQTPMGESFYGFWRLVASSERDEFVAMVRAIYSSSAIPDDLRARRALLGLLDRLREQGQVVLDANRQLTRHVRRALDHQEIETRRLMIARVHELQVLLLGHREELEGMDGISIDETFHVNLPMDRPLYDPPQPVVVETVMRQSEAADIRDAARQIASAGVIDFGRLLRSLDEAIQANAERGSTGVMLSTHVRDTPPRHGVLELLGYVHIGRGLADDAQILEDAPFEWDSPSGRKITCPDVLFLSVKKFLK